MRVMKIGLPARAAFVATTSAALLCAGCTPNRYELPSNPRLEVEGRPVVKGPPTARLTLLPRRSLPVVKIRVRGPFGEAVWIDALIDTGALSYMDIPRTVSDIVKPWVWQDSVGRVRTWSLGRGTAALGVLESIQIGTIDLVDVPVIISPDSINGGGAILGMQALAVFDVVQFDWALNQVVLCHGLPEPSSRSGESTGPGQRTPIRWWSPTDRLVGRDRGYAVISLSIDDQAFEAWIDTGDF